PEDPFFWKRPTPRPCFVRPAQSPSPQLHRDDPSCSSCSSYLSEHFSPATRRHLDKMDAPEPDQTPFASVTAHTSKIQRVRLPQVCWPGLAWPGLAWPGPAPVERRHAVSRSATSR